MPKPKKRQRRRKHRGTQSGRIDTRGRTSRPRSRAEAKAVAQQRRQSRFAQEPTLRGAVGRAAAAAGVFIVLVVFLFKQPALQGVVFGLLAFAVYVPLGHYVDRFMYKRHLRRKTQRVDGDRK